MRTALLLCLVALEVAAQVPWRLSRSPRGRFGREGPTSGPTSTNGVWDSSLWDGATWN